MSVGERLRRPAVVLLYAAAAVAAVGNQLHRLGSSFLSTGLPGYGEAATGDHLQTTYWFWLVGHRLEQGATPWIDPYSFQPLVDPRVVFGGWPYGFAFWPLDAAFGPVIAWNVLLLLVTLAAGLLTYAWLRALGLPVAAAVVGGLAFELAPYRLAQSGGHLLGWIAVLLPLALLAVERSRAAPSRPARHLWGALAAVALASIPLSGQVHLALGAIPLVLGYAAVRFRLVPFVWAAAGAVAAIGAGLLVNALVIGGSTESGGRAVSEVEAYQLSWSDFVDRTRGGELERFAHLGWLVLVLAAIGLVILARRRPWLAALLGLAVAVPVLLAVGTSTPAYEAARAAFPPLRYPRVPGRLLPIADLGLAALAAYGSAALVHLAGTRPFGTRRTPVPLHVPKGHGAAPDDAGRRRRFAHTLAAALVVLVAADLTVWPLRPSAADSENAAYAALGPGRILELPIMQRPHGQFGSVYLYYATQEPRERPTGYAAAPPEEQATFTARWNGLDCGDWRPGDAAELERLGIRSILLHRGLYDLLGETEATGAAERGLLANGWRPVTTDGRITLFKRDDPAGAPPAQGQAPGACDV